MVPSAILLILGIIGLWFGGGIIIPAAKRISERMKISEIVIGLTVVSIGTSIPEIATNITAGYSNLQGVEASGIAIGNIVGSCLSQITLVIGIVGLFATMYITHRSLKRDGFMMIFAILAMTLAAIDLHITQLEGMILVGIYLAYIIYLLKGEKIFVKTRRPSAKHHKNILDLVLILVGTTIVVIAATLTVNNGVTIAKALGAKEALIGILVGLGTTLPELSISLKAALEKSKLSIGNLIGSNITDPLLSLGLGASIAGFSVTKETMIFAVPFWLIGSIIALLLLHNHANLNKNESAVLILIFTLFIYLQFFIMG